VIEAATATEIEEETAAEIATAVAPDHHTTAHDATLAR
jgi:hypothetical protein